MILLVNFYSSNQKNESQTNKSILQIEIGIAKNKLNSTHQYPFASINKLKAEITAAQSVYENISSTQIQINNAVESLKSAEIDFESSKIKLITTELQSTIINANQKVDNVVPGTSNGQYPQVSIDTFKYAISSAQYVLTNSQSTQEQINNGYCNKCNCIC